MFSQELDKGCDPFAMRGEKNKADKTPILPLEKSAKTLRLPMAVLFISMRKGVTFFFIQSKKLPS
ncbi:hypothetical protein E1A91_D11G236300v1 [Gossypium mustelinum]|uniref:Uncharacterized protein n=1 Tax=Gossypium mustelinum TaxID=34275 RepID=A0A5D2SVF1_GOSMU|nr:hypothetical protein E1A91_D11G236300v1 [Gossypium mustelinum]